MLGEQIGELKGKITGQRVLDAEGPAMETNVSATGNLVGSKVHVTLTYMGKSISNGVLHGWGNGVVMSTEGDVASYTGEAIRKIDSSGTVRWRGSLFYKSSSNGKLQSLNNLVVVLEAEVDGEGNFYEKTCPYDQSLFRSCTLLSTAKILVSKMAINRKTPFCSVSL